jgi:hypothetical protein
MKGFWKEEERTQYDPDTARATLEACTHDLDREEDRMRTIDGKLTQLAAFSGVSISISGGLGGSVLAEQRLPLGFAIALGASIAAAAFFLLAAVILAFRALSPKKYQGVDETAVIERTTPTSLNRELSEALATFAGSRREALLAARAINDQKAEATIRTFWCVALGFLMLVSALLVAAVGSVV